MNLNMISMLGYNCAHKESLEHWKSDDTSIPMQRHDKDYDESDEDPGKDDMTQRQCLLLVSTAPHMLIC